MQIFLTRKYRKSEASKSKYKYSDFGFILLLHKSEKKVTDGWIFQKLFSGACYL